MTEARKLVISVIVVVLVLIGAGTWLVLGLGHADALQKTIKAKNAQLSSLQDKIAAVPELRQERQRLVSELEQYETILPNSSELNKILETLSAYEKQAGCQIRLFTPVAERAGYQTGPQMSYRKVSYDLEFSGDYFCIIKFFNLLENHNRFVQLDSFSIKQKEEASLLSTVNVRLSTFVYDPKVAAAKPRPPAGQPRPATADVPFDLSHELDSRYVFSADFQMRDPFTNPLTRKTAVARTVKFETKRLSPEQEAAAADDVEKKLGQIEALVDRGNLEEAAKLLDDAGRIRAIDFRDAGIAKRASALARNWQRFDIMVRTAQGEHLYKIAQDTYAKMVKAFDAENYDEVFRLKTSIEELAGVTVKAGQKPVEQPGATDGEALHERLGNILKDCDTLCKRTKTRLEFAGIGIQIQGTFWTGRGDSRKAAAIVNGQVVTEGELLKQDAGPSGHTLKVDCDIVVRKIDRDKVTFGYKDELIDKFQFKQD